MTTFNDFNLSEELNTSLEAMNYSSPTPIQEQAIPVALQGQDILGSAQTGTGKTAAFSIPMIEMILRSPVGNALILTPTRELAKQVLDVVHQLLGQKGKVNTAFIIGGEPYPKQLSQLQKNPRIIVGTPGRINDHLRRGTIKLKDTGFLVLDETDRMLDMGFGVQLDEIVKHLPRERQTLMFSATMPKEIVKLSSKYLDNPKRISVGETNIIAPKIKQEVIHIDQSAKFDELKTQLTNRQGSVIVFVKTKYSTEKIAKNLCRDGFEADALHGDLRQRKRDQVMRQFRAQKFTILIATDIAARGLDVPHIEHVINYDLPQVAEDFIHRMGRTARAGATGCAMSFVSKQEGRQWHAIEMLLDPEAAMKKGSRDLSGRKGGKVGKGRKRNDRGGRSDSRGGKPNASKYDRNSNSRNRDDRSDNNGQKRDWKKKPHNDSRDNNRDDNRGDSRGNYKKEGEGKAKRNNNFKNKFAGDGNSSGDKRSSFKRDESYAGDKKPYNKKKRTGSSNDSRSDSRGDKPRSASKNNSFKKPSEKVYKSAKFKPGAGKRSPIRSAAKKKEQAARKKA